MTGVFRTELELHVAVAAAFACCADEIIATGGEESSSSVAVVPRQWALAMSILSLQKERRRFFKINYLQFLF